MRHHISMDLFSDGVVDPRSGVHQPGLQVGVELLRPRCEVLDVDRCALRRRAPMSSQASRRGALQICHLEIIECVKDGRLVMKCTSVASMRQTTSARTPYMKTGKSLGVNPWQLRPFPCCFDSGGGARGSPSPRLASNPRSISQRAYQPNEQRFGRC